MMYINHNNEIHRLLSFSIGKSGESNVLNTVCQGVFTDWDGWIRYCMDVKLKICSPCFSKPPALTREEHYRVTLGF